mgnify:CR=1 FL=1
MKGAFRKPGNYQNSDEYLWIMKIEGIKNRRIDHIVYAVFDLDKSMDDFEELLGVRPIFGGYHKTFGTKNALINLDKGVYLELLAADNSNMDVQKPRWMGVDVLKEEQITRWALKSDKLENDSRELKKYNPKMGQIAKGSRNTATGSLLRWELTMPLSLLEVELVPFMLDWGQSEIHPHEALPKMGCELVQLYGTHPDPELYTGILSALGLSFRIEKASEIRLKMLLKSPKGNIEL